jgi:hypothetical protein
MMPTRATRSLASIGLAWSLVFALLLLPSSALAKTPNWSGSVTPTPPTVPAGGVAGYEVSITNNGPSNISKLYLATQPGAPNPVYVSDPRCKSTGPLQCSFGALRKKRSLTVTVAFPTPAESSSDFEVTFVWTTSGLGKGGGDNSHGDALVLTGTTAVSDDLQDFAGGFLVPGGPTLVANDQDIGTANPQAASLFAPRTGIGATVGDGSPGICPPGFECFGEATNLVVGNGSTQYGMFRVVMTIDSSIIPSGVTPASFGVLHVLDNGTVDEITDLCPPSGTPSSPCKKVETLGSEEVAGAGLIRGRGGHDDCDDDRPWRSAHRGRGGHDDDCDPPPPPPPSGSDLQVTVWLDQNGYIKFH